MEQLELFPNDIVRYATSLSLTELESIKDRSDNVFRKIMAIRNLVHRHHADIKHFEKKFQRELNETIWSIKS